MKHKATFNTVDKGPIALNQAEEEVMAIITRLLDVYGKEIPLHADMVITTHYEHGMFTTDTTRKTVNAFTTRILEDMIVSGTYDPFKMLEIYRTVVSIYNDVYNVVIEKSVKFVGAISIVDYMEIQLDPKLLKAIDVVREKMDVKSINDAYKIVDYILKEDKQYEDNIIALMYRSGIISGRQTKQIFGPRGYETELNAKIFKYPLAESFTLGLNDLYSFSTETRAAAKALFQSTKAIQDSEYFSRTLQLLTMVVERVVYTDCGNTSTIDWYVKPREEYQGTTSYNGDLGGLVGKHYYEDGQWKVIRGDEDHLVGTTIKLRSIKDCKLDNPHHVCVACFGNIGYNIPHGTNIGILAATMLLALVTQMILSTKHFAGSANIATLKLEEHALKFFDVKRKGFSLKTGHSNKSIKTYITIQAADGYGIKDLNRHVDFKNIDPARVTRIETLMLTKRKVEDGELIDEADVYIKQQNRFGYFSVKFLEYVVNKGYTIDDYGNYLIDVSGWKQATPFITIPDIEFSFSDFGAELKKLIVTRKFNKDGETSDTYETLLSRVYTMITTKLSLPISYVEVIIYALTIYDGKNRDFRLGRNSPTPGVGNLITGVNSRSMGTGYGFNDLKRKMLSPEAFTSNSATDTLLDVLLVPQETINAFNERNI